MSSVLPPACRYNVDEAAERYIQFLAWRRKEKLDDIRAEIARENWTPREVPHYKTLAKFWTIRMYWSKDREGNPVVYDCLGKVKAAELLAALNEADIIRFHLYVMEHKQMLLDRLSREAGHLIFCYEIKAGFLPNPNRTVMHC
jgi:hypothetical protein